MKDFWKNLKFAWRYAKNQKKQLIGYIICNLFSIFINIFVPILSANIIVDLTNNQFKQVLWMTAVILFVELFRNLISYFSRYFSQILYRETFTRVQAALGSEILKMETQCIDKSNSGVFIQRLTNDTSRIADVFGVFNMYLSNILINIGIFGAVFIINKIAFMYLIFIVIILYFVEKRRIVLVHDKDKIFRKKNENVSGFVGELVRGVRDIKMLNAQTSFMDELEQKVVDLNQFRYAMGKTDRNYSLLNRCLTDLFNAGLIVLLVHLLMIKEIQMANALVIYNYMGRVVSFVSYVSMFMEKVKDFNLSSTRIFSVLDSSEFPKEKFGNQHLSRVKGNFEFKNVTFGYKDNEPVLKNISFKVNANETVAFVGKSGAGKTTIFNLLCKLYEIKEGSISIDGVPISQLDRDTIRGNITIISQNPYIFNLSIRDNLRLVKKDLTEKEMINACKMACLHEFIEQLPDGYDTIVGEGGINLSGGQRQRLAIARAFVQKTEIILFDEATSALDNETQASIQQAIENLQKKYTILIIAHRLSTVINSDRILFLNNGTVEAEGSHQELLKTNKDYKHLYESEMSKE